MRSSSAKPLKTTPNPPAARLLDAVLMATELYLATVYTSEYYAHALAQLAGVFSPGTCKYRAQHASTSSLLDEESGARNDARVETPMPVIPAASIWETVTQASAVMVAGAQAAIEDEAATTSAMGEQIAASVVADN